MGVLLVFMRFSFLGKSKRERFRGLEEGGGTNVGFSILVLERVRVVVEKEIFEEVGKKEGRCVLGAKGKAIVKVRWF